MIFLGAITNDRSELHAKGQDQMSFVKFQGHTTKKSSILTQIERFRTVTPVRIRQWLHNNAQSLK